MGLFYKLSNKATKKMYFENFVKNTQIWACGTHPFRVRHPIFCSKKDRLCLIRWSVKFQAPPPWEIELKTKIQTWALGLTEIGGRSLDAGPHECRSGASNLRQITQPTWLVQLLQSSVLQSLNQPLREGVKKKK